MNVPLSANLHKARDLLQRLCASERRHAADLRCFTASLEDLITAKFENHRFDFLQFVAPITHHTSNTLLPSQ
jgi:hypothetical protein